MDLSLPAMASLNHHINDSEAATVSITWEKTIEACL